MEVTGETTTDTALQADLAYVAEHLLGWERDAGHWWQEHTRSSHGLDWLLTGDGMLAVLRAMRAHYREGLDRVREWRLMDIEPEYVVRWAAAALSVEQS